MGSSYGDDVLKGLSGKQKFIPSRYIFDDVGSEMFQRMMELPEYYVTRSETEIIKTKAKGILNTLNFDDSFNVIDIGCGDGMKTLELIKQFQAEGVSIDYYPVDMSSQAVKSVIKIFSEVPLGQLRIHPWIGNFYERIETWKEMSCRYNSNLFLLIGGTIGNIYPQEDVMRLLKMCNRAMGVMDKILIGFDLKDKDPWVIHRAYNQGINREMNFNVLVRMKNELCSDVDPANFGFYCTYNPENGEHREYLFSKKAQTIKVLNREFKFTVGETIHTDISKKYSVSDVQQLAETAGFKVLRNFYDKKRYIMMSLWEK